MTESKAVVTQSNTTEAIVAMLPRLASSRQMIADTLAGGTITEFQLDRVRVPGAGGTTWTVPGTDGDEETKTIEGVVVGFKRTRAYWAKSYSATNPTPPDCSSADGIFGTGDRGSFGSGPQECRSCPLAEWGSKGEGRRSQACKTMIPIFLLRPDSLIPLMISVPPSSLRTVESYFLRILGQGLPYWGGVTAFELKKREIGGYPTAVIEPRLVSRLTAEQAAEVKSYKEALAPLVEQTRVDADAIEAEAI